MAHNLETLEAAVDQTHPGLGPLAAFTLMCVKASRMTIIVAPSGCGKSKITEWIERELPHSMFWRVGTAAGIAQYQDEFNGFESAIVIDDLAAMGNNYRREQTLMIFADLVYAHRTRIDTGNQSFHVTNFNGSCVIGAQPVVLKDLVKTGGWDGHLHDKTIRYYHLARPIEVCLDDIAVPIELGIPFKNVEPINVTDELFGRLARWLKVQWSTARAQEHTRAMLLAAAALDNRTVVERHDVEVVARLCKPLVLEGHLLYRRDFEAPRTLRNDVYYMVLEFASRGTMTIADLVDSYGVSETSARRMLDEHANLWKIVKKTPTVYAPSELMEQILKEVKP